MKLKRLGLLSLLLLVMQSVELSAQTPENTYAKCHDGIDNDGNGLVDALDSSCYRLGFAQSMNCPAEGILIQANTSDWTTIDLVTGSFVTNTDTFNAGLNSIGYNIKDNRIWGTTYASDGRLMVSSRNADGTWTTILTPAITGLPKKLYYVGDVDTSGVLLLKANADNTIYKVNVNPLSSSYLSYSLGPTMNATLAIHDWAYNRVDGRLYTITKGTRLLYRINPLTGVVDSLGPTGIQESTSPPDQFGAMYFDLDGFLYGAVNVTGDIYRLDLTTSPGVLYDSTKTVLFVVGPGNTTLNDGARCVLAPLPVDLGDAPDSYGTLFNSNGARHFIKGYSGSSSDLYFGTSVRSETEGQPSANADAATDDNGINVIPLIMNSGTIGQVINSYSLKVGFRNNSGQDAYFAAWIDWNNNGVFDSSEGVTATKTSSFLSDSVTFTWSNVTLSSAGYKSKTYARIRVSNTEMTTTDAKGAFSSGEVEDYAIPFSVPLPVAIKSFDAQLLGDQVNLTWTTANESELANYEIEKSVDGQNFWNIAEVPAMNNFVEENRYSYQHKISEQSLNYYFRVYAKDFSGCKSVYSPVRKVSILRAGLKREIKVYPNPTNGILNLELPSKMAELSISNVLGQTLKTQKLNSANTQLNLDAYEKGVYFLRIGFEDSTSQTIKIIKE